MSKGDIQVGEMHLVSGKYKHSQKFTIKNLQIDVQIEFKIFVIFATEFPRLVLYTLKKREKWKDK